MSPIYTDGFLLYALECHLLSSCCMSLLLYHRKAGEYLSLNDFDVFQIVSLRHNQLPLQQLLLHCACHHTARLMLFLLCLQQQQPILQQTLRVLLVRQLTQLLDYRRTLQ